MTRSHKMLGAVAFSLALAGGGAAGALLGTPALSSAQDEPTTQTTETTEGTADRPGPGHHRGQGLATAAEALGISEDELRTALQDGQSIAQVAEAQGVDVQTVIDAMVANGTARLEAAIAELPDRVAELVEREGLPERRGHRGPGRPPADRPDGAIDAPAEDTAS